MGDGSVSLEDFANDPPAKDFRRANGAPMVKRLDDPTKWERYSRPSGWGKDLDEESALVNWKIDRAIEGVALDPALRATIAANIDVREGAAERRERAINRGRGDEAADIGTALHAMAARVELGDGFVVPPEYAADIAAYLSCLDAAGLVSEFIEFKVCVDAWRAAGTPDRMYRATRDLFLPSGEQIPAGSLIMGDLKTGRKKDYSIPGYVIQMAIYVDGCFYDVHTDERSPFPPDLRADWGLIVRMPAGTGECELLWADLEVGREGAAIVQQVRRWRRREDFIAPFKMPEPDTEAVLSEVLLAMEPDECTCSSPDYGTAVSCPIHGAPEPIYPDEWIEMMVPFAQDRINRIGQASNECRDLLLRRWPAYVAPLRAATPTGAQLTQVLDLLDAVEAAFSLPFLPDPRSSLSAGLHTSQIDRTNQPPSHE